MKDNTPEPWTEAELRDQFACYEDKDRPWTLDLYNHYGESFDRAIAKIKADAIRAAGEAMEYALSFDDTYVHNSWLQDYADSLEEV